MEVAESDTMALADFGVSIQPAPALIAPEALCDLEKRPVVGGQHEAINTRFRFRETSWTSRDYLAISSRWS